MKLFKQNVKTFYKPLIIYLITIQVLVLLLLQMPKESMPQDSTFYSALMIFISSLSFITIPVYTLLFSVYQQVKTNQITKELPLTDGYWIFRIADGLGLIAIMLINGIVALEINGAGAIEAIIDAGIIDQMMILLYIIPAIVVAILAIAYNRKRPIFKTPLAIISLGLIVAGIYAAVNLYYLSNSQQAAAVLIFLFAIIYMLCMSVKERNSQTPMYRYVGIGLATMSVIISIILMATSEFVYTDPNPEFSEDANQAYIETTTSSVTEVDTKFGKLHISETWDNDHTKYYMLTTDRFMYRGSITDDGYIDLIAYDLSSYDEVSLFESSNDNVTDMTISKDNQETGERQYCSGELSQIKTESKCSYDPEIDEVFAMLKTY